jgi:predicted phage terminase large subunit-like protein
LWPQKHSIETLRQMEKAAPYVFAGQYLQKPAPPQGGLFKPDCLIPIEALPAINIEWVRGWDLAASVDGDYTAGAKLGKLPDGRFVIADMVRSRLMPDTRDAILQNIAKKDGVATRISLPQDPGQAGKTQILYLTRQLAGFSVKTSPESGDKITRAMPLAAQINVGNVLMLKGSWNESMINEMQLFPNGTYDDQIDALSRAFETLMGSKFGMLDWIRGEVEN